MKASPRLKSLSLTAAVTLGGAAVFWAALIGTGPAGLSPDPVTAERKFPVRPELAGVSGINREVRTASGQAVHGEPATSAPAPSRSPFPAGHAEPERNAPTTDSPPPGGTGHRTSNGTASAEPLSAEVVAVESPGAQLTIAGQSVTVESYSPIPGALGPALTVVISPSPEAAPPPPRTGPHPAGFTRDEELFRTKWGWAAHEAVRRAAREEEQTSH